jgi:hypothetical protein
MNLTIRDEYSGSKFRDLLEELDHDLWRPGRTKTVTVRGPVRVDSATHILLPPLTRLIFLEVFDLPGVTVNGDLDFSRCLFVQGLILRNTEIKGDLHLDDAELLLSAPVVGELRAGLDMAGARIHGAFRAPRLNASRIKVDCVGATVAHRVDLRGAQVGALDARDATLHGALRLDEYARGNDVIRTEIGEMDFDNAAVHGDFFMSGLRVKGGASFRSTTFSGDVLAMTARTHRTEVVKRADFSDSSIDGVLRLRGARFHDLRLVAAEIGGGIDIGCHFPDAGLPVPSEIVTLDLSSAIVGADVLCSGVLFGQLVATSAKINGKLDIRSGQRGRQFADSAIAEAHSVWNEWLAKAEVEESCSRSPLLPDGTVRSVLAGLTADGLETQGGIYLAGLQVLQDVRLIACAAWSLWIWPDGFRPAIGGTLHLSAITIAPYVDVKGLLCGREVRVVASKLGPAHFRFGIINEEIVLCEIGALTIRDCEIAGFLDLTHLQVNGSVTGIGLQGVVIEQCEVRGEVSFWQRHWIEQIRDEFRETRRSPQLTLPGRCDHGAAVVGPVIIRNCTIGADCDLTFLKAHGPLTVENNAIAGGLYFRSTATVSEAFPDEDELRTLDPQQATFRATAPALFLRMTTVERDVDLTGVSLFAGSSVPPHYVEEHGNCVATFMRTKGELRAYRASDQRRPEAYAKFPGRFDLSFGQATHLLVSGHSFSDLEPGASAGNLPIGLLLRGGKFQRVTFPYSRKSGHCPRPTDLADVQVEVWRLGDTTRETTLESYYELFKTDQHFRQSTYRSIEGNLRNRGREDDAIQIYRAMKIAEGKGTPWWRRPYFPFWQHVLRFGTSTLRLGVIILLLAIVSSPVYFNADNVKESSDAVMKRRMDAFLGAPAVHPPEFGFRDGALFLIRYHIPILPLEFPKTWELRDAPGTKWFNFRIPYLDPDGFSKLMTVLNLIMWPLLAAFVGRRLLRQ